MEKLKSYLQEFHNVSDPIMDNYIALWKEYTLSKRQTMKVPGQIEKHLYFVISGIQKSFYLHKEKEHVIALLILLRLAEFQRHSLPNLLRGII